MDKTYKSILLKQSSCNIGGDDAMVVFGFNVFLLFTLLFGEPQNSFGEMSPPT